MITTRTCIIAALCGIVPLLSEAWHNVSEPEKQIDVWSGIDYKMSKDWVWLFVGYKLAPWLMAVIAVIDSKGKDPIKRALYWTLLIFFSWEIYRFFLNFCKDNYFYIYFLTYPVVFLICMVIRYDNKNDIRRSIRKALTMNYQCIYTGEILTPDEHAELTYYEQFKYSTTFKKVPKHQKILDEGFVKASSTVLKPFEKSIHTPNKNFNHLNTYQHETIHA